MNGYGFYEQSPKGLDGFIKLLYKQYLHIIECASALIANASVARACQIVAAPTPRLHIQTSPTISHIISI